MCALMLAHLFAATLEEKKKKMIWIPVCATVANTFHKIPIVTYERRV